MARFAQEHDTGINYWLWVTTEEYIGRVEEEGNVWSCSPHTQPGDLVLIYQTGVKQILYLCEATSTARPNSKRSRWSHHCEYEVLQKFRPPIEVSTLAQYPKFREWGTYRKHFQGSYFRIPPEIWRIIELEWNNHTPRKPKGRKGAYSSLREISNQSAFNEGFRREIVVNKRERDPKLVKKAREYYGTQCYACGFDFGSFYGEHREGFIEIHHKKPVSQMEDEGETTLLEDVVPLCSNCHRMIHRGTKILTVEELKDIIKRSKKIPGKQRQSG